MEETLRTVVVLACAALSFVPQVAGERGHDRPTFALRRDLVAPSTDAALPRPASGEETGGGQVVAVVVPPGPLMVVEPPHEVELVRDGGRCHGRVLVSVADARGRDADWTLRVGVGRHDERGDVEVTVRRVDAMALSVDGLRASFGRGPAGQPLRVLTAAAGRNLGLFDIVLDASAPCRGRTQTEPLDLSVT